MQQKLPKLHDEERVGLFSSHAHRRRSLFVAYWTSSKIRRLASEQKIFGSMATGICPTKCPVLLVPHAKKNSCSFPALSLPVREPASAKHNTIETRCDANGQECPCRPVECPR